MHIAPWIRFELDVRALLADLLQLLERHFPREDDQFCAEFFQNSTESHAHIGLCRDMNLQLRRGLLDVIEDAGVRDDDSSGPTLRMV